LIDRFNVPSILPERDKDIVRMRVGLLLKYWIESQFDEFDDHIIQLLQNFIGNTVKEKIPDLGDRLLAEIARLQAERVKRTQFFAMPSIEFFMPQEKKSPLQLFMCFDDAEIARQLTLIEFNMFAEIRPKELMNQSWLKPKLKHRSPNVLRMIDRSNSVSMWMAHAILSLPTPELRAEMCTKIVNITMILRQMHNFNTVFAIMQGLNRFYVDRLKRSWEKVSPEVMKNWKSLSDFILPNHAYKEYRDSLTQSKPPILPSIHVYLNDIALMEEGNPAITHDGRINFARNVIICKSIAELQLYQNTRYPFCSSEPLFSFLTELPAIDDGPMYNLSLAREPRESAANRETQSDSKSSTGTETTKKFGTLHRRG